ncbi:MAG: cytochrome c-type biogenesis CcmF C-terminal domain-containing protein [Pseudomonadota bacterium]|nr:cytochrome c-type biogenesis CcmF C-terminal domain-containing protein [Pseudomonadota bacterium]
MLSQLGNFFIALGLSASFIQLFTVILNKGYFKYALIISYMAVIHFLSISLAFLILIYGFIISDFTIQNVLENSHSLKPMIYKISGSWGSHEGSMLLWCWVMAFYGFLITINKQSLKKETKSLILLFQGFLSFGFVFYLYFLSNPLESSNILSEEGYGLNPLLQDPGLAFHPPFLYLGYVGLSIVWSFALAGLIRNTINKEWARNIRIWALTSWVFLTIGISLGSWWAYYELGWGGYWFWDPVENVSLIPWIIATALIHNLLALEKKEILINWSVLLSLLGFILSIIGTFIVRSGLITSVHAFASDPTRGIFIILLLFLVTLLSLSIYAKNYIKKQPNVELNFFSKETFLIINNLLLSVIAFTVFLGTIYPLIVETINNNRISVGPPFYNITVIPFAILLAFFSALGPILAWNQNSIKQLLRNISIPLGLTLIITIAIFFMFENLSLIIFIGLFSGIWLFLNSLNNLTHIRFQGLNNWASFFAHSGFAILILGVSISSSHQNEYEGKLDINNQINFSGYILKFESFNEEIVENYITTKGKFKLSRNDNEFFLYPEKRFYPIEQSQTTEAAIISSNLSQFYLVLGEQINDKSWVIRIWYKPMIMLIWIGGLFMGIGGLLSLVKRIKIKSAKQMSFFIMLIFLSGNLFADNKIQNNEDRVTDISLQIRCMVCQSQTIDDSDAPLAKDLKQLVRKMVYEGKSNDEIFDFLRSKYGDYILMKPRFNLSNILLWFGPFFIFIIGIYAVLKVFKINFRPN